jgi:hypothetical protein
LTSYVASMTSTSRHTTVYESGTGPGRGRSGTVEDLKQENARLKRVLAEAILDNQILKELIVQNPDTIIQLEHDSGTKRTSCRSFW